MTDKEIRTLAIEAAKQGLDIEKATSDLAEIFNNVYESIKPTLDIWCEIWKPIVDLADKNEEYLKKMNDHKSKESTMPDPSSEWVSCSDMLPSKGKEVDTMVLDDKGARNKQPLVRYNNLWFFPDGSMHVYYTPTHWRHRTDNKK